MKMRIIIALALAVLLVSGLMLISCQHGDRQSYFPINAPIAGLRAPATPQPTTQAAGPSSVMIYIKIVSAKKYGFLAHLVGGMHDGADRFTTYDAANPWWKNPLIVYSDPPFADADAIGRADAALITGRGASGNVAIQLTLVPHADVAVKTDPRSDGIRGTITATISTAGEFYDGHWTEMVHAADRKVTFNFDTCDPLRRVEEIGHETRTIPTFIFERYTRDQTKWEPKSEWPGQAESGDWRVVIYGKDPTLQLTRYRYVEQSAAGAQR